jgi:hypothetical protein
MFEELTRVSGVLSWASLGSATKVDGVGSPRTFVGTLAKTGRKSSGSMRLQLVRLTEAWLIVDPAPPAFNVHPTPARREAIAAAAKELDNLRSRWLNPPEWTRTEVLEFPGSVDGPWRRYVHDPDARGIGTVRYPRVVPKDADSAAKLKKRTLTNLYNERPAWLANAHRKLDEAVAAAYGWAADLSEDELLGRLLALNLERAGRAG